MANRTVYPVATPRNEVHILTARAVGNTTSDPTLPEATEPGGGEIATMTHTGTGTFTGTFRKSYPQLEYASAYIVGATAGLRARFTAIDVTAKTFALTTEINTTATDPATTDTIYFLLFVRNTGRP